MAFESVRGYVQLASGLGELTRARALEAAQGLLALPSMAGTTGKMAGQVGALAEEILAAALANRDNPTALVRGEVDVAVSRLGLVPAADLEGARDEVARLRAEVNRLREATTAGVQGDAGAGTAGGGAASLSPGAEGTPEATTAGTGRKGRPSRKAVSRTVPGRSADKSAVAVGGEVHTPGAEKAAATVRGAARPPAAGAPTVSTEPVTAPGTPSAEVVTAEPASSTSTS